MSIEGITDKAAWAAIFSWIWLPPLESINAIASAILPVFGILWFGVQIYCKLTGRCRGR